MSSANLGGLLVLGGAAAVGALVVTALRKDDKPKNDVTGSTGTEEDICDASFDKLPKVYSDMLTSPSTDLSDPVVVDTIAGQLDAAGYKQQANCLRKFKSSITAAHGTDGEEVSDNCASLVDASTMFDASQKSTLKSAIAAGNGPSLHALAASVRLVDAKLGNCIDQVAKTRDAGGGTGTVLSKDVLDTLMGTGGTGIGAAPKATLTTSSPGTPDFNGAGLGG